MTPVGLALYSAATAGLKPLANWVLHNRVKSGREDPDRLSERRGVGGQPRPEGRLAWIHAASVGESQIALSLAEALRTQRPGLNILITSGTRTSAALIARRGLDGVIHHFPPVDTPDWVEAFFDHWRPDLAVFTESELWPNLITKAKARAIPLALVNGRMNEKSLKSWGRWPGTARAVLGAFDWIGAADQRTSQGVSALIGAPVAELGNLKLECGLPDPDPEALDQIKARIGARPVFVAASTHAGEEALMAATHVDVLKTHPDALMILSPRHPERALAAGDELDAAGLTFARRSLGQTPETKPVWLADTLGEMALWYTLCPAAIIAGSFKPGIGGHNPLEASHAGAAVITGPHVDSFTDVFKAYDHANARLVADTPQDLADAVRAVWAGDGPRPAQVQAALNALPGGALAVTTTALLGLLDRKGAP